MVTLPNMNTLQLCMSEISQNYTTAITKYIHKNPIFALNQSTFYVHKAPIMPEQHPLIHLRYITTYKMYK